MKTPAGEWILAVIVGSALLSVLLAAALRVPDWTSVNPARGELRGVESQATTRIGMGLAGVRVDKLDEPTPGSPDLRSGMSGYLLPFVIVSVHLLVVLIGAAYMARAKRPIAPADEER